MLSFGLLRVPNHNRACARWALAAFWIVLAASASLAQKLPEASQGPSVASRTPDFSAAPSEFTGADRCKSCHKSEMAEFQKTGHSKLTFPDKQFIQGCEACHGPGKAHSDAVEAAHGDDAEIAAALKKYPIFSFRGSPDENAARCLNCHITSKQQDFFAHSEHAGHAMFCGQCHAAHLVDEVKDQSKGDLSYPQGYFFNVPRLADESRWLRNSLLKQSEPGVCFTCHRTLQAEFALPVHHRVPEGLMKCTDCHSPHGTLNRANLKKPAWETCVNCHVEKRGPFVYEHAAVKVEGCATCHNPHGSTNRMLLVRREARQLCLQCHPEFNAKQVPHGRLSFQTSGECVRCHVAIHGSSLDPNFLR
jgi:predicted CXXCH cytochrome family protein